FALAGAVTSLLGYALITRMHERYMFPAVALLAPLVFARQFRRVYGALSVLFLLSLWYPFVFYNTQYHVEALKLEPLYGWIFGGDSFYAWQKKVLSLMVLSIALLVFWRFARWIAELKPLGPPPPPPPPRPARSVAWLEL